MPPYPSGPVRGGSSSTGRKARAPASQPASTTTTTTLDTRPLSGVFAINKPSGPTSSELLDRLKPLLARSALFKTPDGRPVPLEGRMFKKTNRQQHIPPKIGHGGTLDPLADGVLGMCCVLLPARREAPCVRV